MTLNVQNAKEIKILQSKNMVDMHTVNMYMSNATMTESDGVFRMQSISSGLASVRLQIDGLEQGKQYTLSFEARGVVVASTGGSFLRVREGSGSGTWVSTASPSIDVASDFNSYTRTFTATSVHNPWLWFYLSSSANNTNVVDIYFRNVQVEEGDTATDYEPYVAPQEIKAIRDKNNSLIWGRRQYDTKYEGDAWQQTYTGKNLWGGFGTFSKTISGLNFSTQNDFITVSGTATVRAYSILGSEANQNGIYVVLQPGTYYLSLEDALPTGVTVQAVGTDGTTIRSGSGSFTISQQTKVAIRLMVESGTVITNTLTVYPQLEAGSTATPYEPYVGGIPAPNPDYPQDVKAVKGPQQVTVYDRNMFDGQMELGIINGYTGQNSSNDNYTRCKNYIPVSENTVYILSSPTFTGSYNVYEYKSDLTFNMVSNKNTQSGIFTTNAGTAFVRFRPGAQITTAPLTTKYQLEKGSTATAYVPYHGKTYSFDLRGVNMFNFDNGTLYTQNSVTQTHTSNSVHMVATGTTGAQYVRLAFGGFDSSKKYTISCKARKVVKGTDGAPRVYINIYFSDDGSTWTYYTNTGVTDPIQGQVYDLTKSFTGHPYYRFYLYNNVNTPVTVGEETEYWDVQLEEGDTATDFQPYHAPYELAGLGNYADYIWKDGTDWKLHKAIGNTALLSTVGSYNSGTNWYYESFVNIGVPDGVRDAGIMSNYFTAADSYNGMQTDRSNGLIATSGTHVVIRNTACTDHAAYRTWLAAHEVAVYYVLATATDTVITDAALVAQLNAMQEWLTRYGYNHTVVGDLPIVINQESL